MNRRHLIKGIAVVGVASILPRFAFGWSENDHSIHFIGLGYGGCNALTLFKMKGVNGQYTFIEDTDNKDYFTWINNVIDFKTPAGFMDFNSTIYNKEKEGIREIVLDDNPIPSEIKNVFNAKSHYVLMAGLGRYAGTHLTLKLFNHLTKENISFDFFVVHHFYMKVGRRDIFANMIIAAFRDKPNFHYSNNDAIRFKYGNLKMKEAYKIANEELYLLYKSKNK